VSDTVGNSGAGAGCGPAAKPLPLRHPVVPDPYASDMEPYRFELTNSDEPGRRVGKANTIATLS
jgi:hypothetical protein